MNINLDYLNKVYRYNEISINIEFYHYICDPVEKVKTILDNKILKIKQLNHLEDILGVD